MIVLKECLPDFFTFLKQTYGVSLIIRDPPISGEYARAMFRDNLLVIREVGEGSATVEVIHKDVDWLKDAESLWSSVLASLVEDEDVQE